MKTPRSAPASFLNSPRATATGAWRGVFTALAVATAAPLAFAGSCCCAAPTAEATSTTSAKTETPLSVRSLYQLDATWTDDTGASRQLREFRGRPVAIALIFTSCGQVCPGTVAEMLNLQTALTPEQRSRAAFVLVTIDPSHDTTAELRSYRERMQLDGNWTLLRGDAAAVRELAALLDVRYRPEANGQFAHSNLITVLDVGGEVVAQRVGFNQNLAPLARALTGLAPVSATPTAATPAPAATTTTLRAPLASTAP